MEAVVVLTSSVDDDDGRLAKDGIGGRFVNTATGMPLATFSSVIIWKEEERKQALLCVDNKLSPWKLLYTSRPLTIIMHCRHVVVIAVGFSITVLMRGRVGRAGGRRSDPFDLIHR